MYFGIICYNHILLVLFYRTFIEIKKSGIFSNALIPKERRARTDHLFFRWFAAPDGMMAHKKFLFGFLLILVFVLAVVVQPSQTSYAAGTVPTKKPTSKSGNNDTAVPSNTSVAGGVGTPFNATVISVKTLTPTGDQGQGAAANSKKATKTKVPTRTKTPTRTATPTITNTPNPATAANTVTEIGSSTPTPTVTPTFTPVSGTPNALSIIPIEYIKYIYMFCGLLIILAIILIIFLILRRGKQQNNGAPPPDASSPA